MNRKNLLKLAKYLEALPKDYDQFQMATYLSLGFNKELDLQKRYANCEMKEAPCGTVACAVGHGPAAGICVPDYALAYWGIIWSEYTREFIDSPISRENAWLFDFEWSRIDNTPQGAAARIYYLLDGNEIPTYENIYGVAVDRDKRFYQYRLVKLPEVRGDKDFYPTPNDYYPFNTSGGWDADKLVCKADLRPYLPTWAVEVADAWAFGDLEYDGGGKLRSGHNLFRPQEDIDTRSHLQHISKLLRYCGVSHEQKIFTAALLITRWFEKA